MHDNWEDIREFLQYLLKPFAYRKFKAFLRRNFIVLLLLIVSAAGWFSLNPVNLMPMTVQVSDRPVFSPIDPATFRIDQTKGTPFPAIDSKGDLVPIFESGTNRWAIWSLAKKAAVIYAPGIPISYNGSRETPQILLNEDTNELIIGFPMSSSGSLVATDFYSKILILDATNYTPKKSIVIPGMRFLVDISPSGKYLGGMGDFLPLGGGHYHAQPIIVNVQSGKVSRENIRLLTFYFESDESLLGFRSDILRYNFRRHKAAPGLLLETHDSRDDDLDGKWEKFESMQVGWKDPTLRAVINMKLTGFPRDGSEIPRNAYGMICVGLDGKIEYPPTPLSTRPMRWPRSGSRNHIAWEFSRETVNVQRNLGIFFQDRRDAIGSVVGQSVVLLELATAQEYPIDFISTHSQGWRNYIFVNSDLIAVADGHRIQFLSVEVILNKDALRE